MTSPQIQILKFILAPIHFSKRVGFIIIVIKLFTKVGSSFQCINMPINAPRDAPTLPFKTKDPNSKDTLSYTRTKGESTPQYPIYYHVNTLFQLLNLLLLEECTMQV